MSLQGREEYRKQLLDADNQVGATLYVGDGLHRLAKAVEMLLDPTAVETRRFQKRQEDAERG